MVARFALVLAAVVALLAVSSDTLAQTTPAPVPLPATGCANDPITYERMSTIIAAPVATPEPLPSEIASPAPGLLPSGQPADRATADAVHERVLVLTACINRGDLLRTLALYSDRFLSKAFAGQQVTQAAYTAEIGKTNPRPTGA